MPTKSLVTLCFSACLFLFIFGCTKAGPAGPAGSSGTNGSNGANGSTGPAGPQGPSGPSGATGPQGNANVLVDTFTLINSQWAYGAGQYILQVDPTTNESYTTRYFDAPFSAVTQGLLNTGEVLVYFTPFESGIYLNQWAPLPYQFTETGDTYDINIAYQTMIGKVRLHYFFVRKVTTATLPTLSTYDIPTYKFKIVAVSGTISTGMKQAGIDTENYTDVSKYLGL